MSTVSMSIVGAYMSMIDPKYVVTALVLNLFGGFIIASIVNPYEVTEEEDILEVQEEEKQSFFEMLGEYILDGFKVAIIVAAIAILGISFQELLGYVFAPFAFIMGVPWKEAVQAGSIMATKMVSNEFVAMLDLTKQTTLSARTTGIVSVFLVSFANFSSIGIIAGAVKGLHEKQGIGEAPDAAEFDDFDVDTFGHIARERGGLNMPHMASLGLSNIKEIEGVPVADAPKAYYTKMQEASRGKDTMTGHWELMGLYIDTPFRVFENGFPDELIQRIEEKTGRKVIGNKPASGTEILDELGAEHVETGALIVYTSADSVLQIAAHEDVVPLKELYEICEFCREITLEDPYMLGRIIARPFVGEAGNWKRTANRHDYALKPFGRTVMNELQDSGFDVIALGKIADIYDGEGVTKAVRTVSNMDGMDKLSETMDEEFTGLSFLNLQNPEISQKQSYCQETLCARSILQIRTSKMLYVTTRFVECSVTQVHIKDTGFREYGVKNLIRVGTCGGMQEHVRVRDVILAQAACTDSSMNKHVFGGYDFSPIATFSLLKEAYDRATAKGMKIHVGNVFSSDSFYRDDRSVTEKLMKHGVLGVEMETTALYTIAAKFGVNALTILTHGVKDPESILKKR
ncbi:hypothetical protein HK101_004203 [Irineochytrium annulatum]|nr:hypothetical protein HK101_004203 [Irineochytrium annulatum]